MADQTFKCGQCGKQLNSEKELRAHEQIHTGQRQNQPAGGQSQQAGQGGQTRL